MLIHLRRAEPRFVIGGATYAFEVASVLPLLTAVFAFLLSLDGITREQGEGAWTTVTLCEVSNAGYLLRRWLALQAVILPLTRPALPRRGRDRPGGRRPPRWTLGLRGPLAPPRRCRWRWPCPPWGSAWARSAAAR